MQMSGQSLASFKIIFYFKTTPIHYTVIENFIVIGTKYIFLRNKNAIIRCPHVH